MKKSVLLLAVSCKNGGLCPGGIDINDPSKWIRIVDDDGCAGAVQGCDIDFAKPLDIIQFNGRHVPQGKQQENWVIENNSCVNRGRIPNKSDLALLNFAYKNYSYHGFWGNYKAYLNEDEFEAINCPSESILKVTDVRIYKNNNNKAKIDFNWDRARYRICGISMTDQELYDDLDDDEILYDEAYIIVSIPKEIDDWVHPDSGECRAYKFVSKVFEI